MDINIDCSGKFKLHFNKVIPKFWLLIIQYIEIINDDFSQFMDGNS